MNTYKQITSDMKLQAQKIQNDIMISHMKGISKNDFLFPKGQNFSIGYYSKSQIQTLPITFKDDQQIYNNKSTGTIYYIDSNLKGIWGIDYIVIKENEFLNNTFERIQSCIFLFGSIYLFVVFIGYVLARYFIEPIIEQRNQLNNFIRDTTHELNTPISAITMSINDEYTINEKSLQRIKYSAKRISEIYSDMTYLFLKDTNDIRTNIKSYNLKTILEEQLLYLTEMAKQKNQSVFIDIQDFYLDIDKEDFIRLVNNLISNSIKYTPKNGEIRISLKNNILTISDNGRGISKDKQTRVFDRFYRASKEVGGFGIGLNIVKNICLKYNFKIELNSTPKKGTQFKVFLK